MAQEEKVGHSAVDISKVKSLLEFSAVDIDGKKINFKDEFAGKVLLVVNVACKCGFTKSGYNAMEQLSIDITKKYGSNNDPSTVPFKILLFPCNQVMYNSSSHICFFFSILIAILYKNNSLVSKNHGQKKILKHL